VRKALPRLDRQGRRLAHHPTGKFFIGGPDGDTGLTAARSSSILTGGAAARGGAFSGKDPTKVDRSARTLRAISRKTSSRRALPTACTIQLSYASRRRQAAVDLCRHLRHRQGDEAAIEKALGEVMDLTHAVSVRSSISTNRSIREQSAYGNFGRPPEKDGGFSWERTDLARRSPKPFPDGGRANLWPIKRLRKQPFFIWRSSEMARDEPN